MLKVELHSHTSDDPRDRIPPSTHQPIDRAAELGYQALAATRYPPVEGYGAIRAGRVRVESRPLSLIQAGSVFADLATDDLSRTLTLFRRVPENWVR